MSPNVRTSRPGSTGRASAGQPLPQVRSTRVVRVTPKRAGRPREMKTGPEGPVRDAGGAARSRTGLNGFAIRCITALLPRRIESILAQRADVARQPPETTKGSRGFPSEFGAGNESRTRDLNLGKVALYQLSYSRIVSPFCFRIRRSAHYRAKRAAFARRPASSLNASVHRRCRPRPALRAPARAWSRPPRPAGVAAPSRARLRARGRSTSPARSRGCS